MYTGQHIFHIYSIDNFADLFIAMTDVFDFQMYATSSF